MEDLEGKAVLITGASRGIGAAVALGFAKYRAKLAITYQTNADQARTCSRSVKEKGADCLIMKADVSNPSDVKNAVKETMDKYGRIDILVNNAGIWKEGAIGSMTDRQWDETIDVNLKGTFLFCNEIAPLMKAQKKGKIINISSTAGQRGEAFHSHYAASKGGVIAFTKSIAVELAPFGINVNSVSPGWVETDMTGDVLGDRQLRADIDRAIPRGQVATPDDIVGAVLFLASDISRHIIGATINVNGGSVLF